MKTIYFVRHGESVANATPVYQTIDSPLSEKGMTQAKYIAERCAKLPIDIIVSSTQLRARMTADIIRQKFIHIVEPVECSDLFRERRKPTALNDKSLHDSSTNGIQRRWWRSLIDQGPREADGENFEDINARAGSALQYLAGRFEERILVVTHGFFMRYIVAKSIYGDDLTGALFAPLARSLRMENTGLTVLRYHNETAWRDAQETSSWQFWIWNDHAHLG